MRIGLFLPHSGVFGGVRRFLELGNVWSARGHEVRLFTPDGAAPSWLEFHGSTAPLVQASTHEVELALGADPHTYDAFRSTPARVHVYYCVIEGDPGVRRAARDATVQLAANSGALRAQLARETRRPVIDGAGGIRLTQFRPDASKRAASPLRVLVNGRRSRPKKGTDLVLSALRSLRKRLPFETVLFDTLDEHNRQDPRIGAQLPPEARFVLNPTQSELVELYQSSHLFVAAERKAGWCNTALEALACGCALVCTRSGTSDFARPEMNALMTWRHPWFLERAIRRLLMDPALRASLSAAGPASAEPWSWERLAEKLLAQLPELGA